MAKENIVTANREEAFRLCRRVISNIPFLNNEDMKVLEHLSKKGFYETQKAKLVPNKQ